MMTELLHYEHLRLIWWLLLGVVLSGFAILDGFDFGAIALLPFVAREEQERRIVLNTLGALWEGNQVWLILGGGVIFAAFPLVYAVAFSGLLEAILLLLFFLILRPVAFKYRSKLDHPVWRSTWDVILCLCGVVPALVFGVGVGNALLGVPFHFDSDLRMQYTGSFWSLFSPFALLCGLLSLTLMITQGALYLNLKTEGRILERARSVARWTTMVALILFAVGGLAQPHISAYQVTSALPHDAPSNPLNKEVGRVMGGWLMNFKTFPWFMIAPGLAFLGFLAARVCLSLKKHLTAFVFHSLAVMGVVFTAGCSLFPFLLPSSSHPNMGLTIWDASSSLSTLKTMLYVAVFFLPIVLTYIAWAYRLMRGVVNAAFLKQEHSSY